MESTFIPLPLGLLSESQIQMIKSLPAESKCRFTFFGLDSLENEPSEHTVEIIKDYVIEKCPQTGGILSGFKCDYEHNFQILRSQTDDKKKLGSPQELIITLDQGEHSREIHLRANDDVQKIENFAKILSTKYIVRKGFRESFRPLVKLGKGMTAAVYKAESLLEHEQVAIKTFKRSVYFQNPNGKESFQKEFKVLSKLKHKNLCELIGVYETENSTYIVMELLQQTLYSYLKDSGFPKLKLAQQIMKGLLQGVDYLHSLGLMHRDLKLENIMLKANEKGRATPVIVDFGLAEYINNTEFLYTRCGTPGYVAPQILSIKSGEKKTYTQACDIFSLGVIFYILLFKKPIFAGEIKDVIQKNTNCIIDFNIPAFMELPIETQDLMRRMLAKSPEDRISAKEALKHPAINPYRKNREPNPIQIQQSTFQQIAETK